MADTSLYETLGVRPGASEAEIRKVRWLCLKNGVQRMPIRMFQILPPMCVLKWAEYVSCVTYISGVTIACMRMILLCL